MDAGDGVVGVEAVAQRSGAELTLQVRFGDLGILSIGFLKSYTKEWGVADVSVAGNEVLRLDAWDRTSEVSMTHYAYVQMMPNETAEVRLRLLVGAKFKVTAVAAC